jgi:hypothetical protein
MRTGHVIDSHTATIYKPLLHLTVYFSLTTDDLSRNVPAFVVPRGMFHVRTRYVPKLVRDLPLL